MGSVAQLPSAHRKRLEMKPGAIGGQSVTVAAQLASIQRTGRSRGHTTSLGQNSSLEAQDLPHAALGHVTASAGQKGRISEGQERRQEPSRQREESVGHVTVAGHSERDSAQPPEGHRS